MEIRQLGYVGLQGADPKAWLDFATRILGLQPARVLPGESWGMPGMPQVSPGSTRAGWSPRMRVAKSSHAFGSAPESPT